MILSALLRIALLLPSAYAACPPVEGSFAIDKGPSIVSWRFTDAEKAPLFLTEADAPSFTILRSTKAPECEEARFGKDKTHVFYEYEQVLGADAATFEALMGPYGKDSSHVYWKTSEMKNADPASFEVLGFNLARDSKQAYFEAQNFPLKSHRTLQFGYQTLGNFVIFERSKVDGADASSFQPIAPGRGRDAKSIYFGDRRMPHLDRKSFRDLGEAFYADRFAVRCNMEVANGSDEGIPGLDPGKAVAIERSAYKKLTGACRSPDGQIRCLTDGSHLIAIVKIGNLGSLELKAASLKSVKTDSERFLQFGSELYDHLVLVEGRSPDQKNLRSVQ